MQVAFILHLDSLDYHLIQLLSLCNHTYLLPMSSSPFLVCNLSWIPSLLLWGRYEVGHTFKFPPCGGCNLPPRLSLCFLQPHLKSQCPLVQEFLGCLGDNQLLSDWIGRVLSGNEYISGTVNLVKSFVWGSHKPWGVGISCQIFA